jgi:hypothetical protein
MPSTAVERVWGSRLLMTTSNEQYGYKVRETATTAAHPGFARGSAYPIMPFILINYIHN